MFCELFVTPFLSTSLLTVSKIEKKNVSTVASKMSKVQTLYKLHILCTYYFLTRITKELRFNL